MATEEQQGKPIQFYSRHSNLTLWRVSPITEVLAGGILRTAQEGLAYNFEPNGRLTVYVGQDVLPTRQTHLNTAENEDAVDWLRRHPLLNNFFYEDGAEPGRPLPTDADFLRDLLAATADLQEDRVQAMRAQEVESHGRQNLIDACDTALARIADARAALEASYQEGAPRPAEGGIESLVQGAQADSG